MSLCDRQSENLVSLGAPGASGAGIYKGPPTTSQSQVEALITVNRCHFYKCQGY